MSIPPSSSTPEPGHLDAVADEGADAVPVVATPSQTRQVIRRLRRDAVPVVATPSQTRQVIRRLRRDRVAMGAFSFVVVLAILAIFAPVVAPYDPNQIGAGPRFAPFGSDHWLGTDDLGRDTFSRLIYGARVSLRFSLQAVGIAVTIAIPFGLYAGYKGGLIDNAMMRVVDALASVPALILALALIGILGPNLNNAMLAIAVVMSPGFIRLIRAQALAVREETYIEASHSLGTRQRRILLNRVLPNSISPLVVAASIALGQALVAESGLSLLGFGMQPPDASWGSMLDRGRTVLNNQPLQVLIPGLSLAVTTLSFNLFGDGLSDAMGSSRQKGFKTVKGRLGLTTVPAERSEPTPTSGALLEVKGLRVEFLSPAGALPVVEDVSFSINKGEVLGLVGESGSGKTVTSLSIMRLIPSPPGQIAGGSIAFDGTDLLSLSSSEMRHLRGNEISMVFQDPMTSLNPAFTMGDQLIEAIRVHRSMNKDMARRRALELLEMVGIPDPRQRMRDYPHQFSGGMRQRGLLAVALACEPRLLIADEPTTALDVTVQAQILELLKSLQQETGMAMLFVTHDLGVVAELCDRVAVMYAGQIVEQGPTSELFAVPEHPYTSGLLHAIPQVAQAGERLSSIPGVVPTPGAMPGGCRFQPRCPHAIEQCASDPVQLLSSDGRHVRCIRVGQLDLSGAR